MRALFTSLPSAGHLHPLLPLARSLVAGGHHVTIASGSSAADTVAAFSLAFAEAGLNEPEIVAEAAARMPGVAAARRGIAMFAHVAAPALLADVLPQLEQLAPDLVIHEEGEWGGPVAAAVARIPSVAHGWGAPLWTVNELQAIDDETAQLWSENNVAPASPAGLFDHLYLDPCPPVLQAPDVQRITPRQPVRFEPFDSGEELPAWFDDRDGRPLVYVTLGTVPTFNLAPEALAAIVNGVAGIDVDVVITVGKNNNPADLEPLPPNMHAERYLPQAQVLARATLAVTHGGAGSTLAALALGLPLLVLPRGAPSQNRLAARCAEAGAGKVLNPEAVNAAAVHEAVRALLDDARFRTNAKRVRASINEQPHVSALVPPLEALADSSPL